jgi:ferredoxin
VCEVTADVGDCLLDVAQAAGQPLEGTCEGQMACSTCHVIVAAPDFALLSPASSEEEDMLDLATGATRTSRLACQIMLTANINQLTVAIPPESRNMQRR